MNEWIFSALIALMLWGFWGFFPKLATNHIDPKSALVYGALGMAIVGSLVLVFIGSSLQFNMEGFTFAVLTGIAGALGALAFLYSVNKGKVSVVATTTALYPVITIILASAVLGESITPKQGIGILLAVGAITMFSI